MVRVTSALFPMDSTLCIIKPDAMRLGYKDTICHMIHMFGFNVIAEGRFKFTRVRAEEFYRAHSRRPYFEALIRFMISRSVHVMVLVRDNCCRAFRALLGPKDSLRARKEAPQTIRALYGTDGRMNAVHGSDTVKEAEVEIKFFFPTVILEPYPSATEAVDYFKVHVQPLLLKGLTALAKTKPAFETIGACRWLATWLHDHNPRLPLICICEEEDDKSKKEKAIMEYHDVLVACPGAANAAIRSTTTKESLIRGRDGGIEVGCDEAWEIMTRGNRLRGSELPLLDVFNSAKDGTSARVEFAG